MKRSIWHAALLLFAITQLGGCGGPAGLAYMRGHVFEESGDQHYDSEDPLSEEGVAIYKRAIEQFDAALKLQPHYGEAHEHRGLCFWRIRDLNHALNDLSAAAALSPKDAMIWKERGWVYRELGLYDKAVEDYDTALRIDAKDPSVLTCRAECELQMHNNKECFDDLDRALELSKGDPDVRCELASAKGQTGDYDTMKSEYEKAINSEPHSPELYQRRGYSEFILGDYAAANDDFHSATAVSHWQYRSSPYSAILGTLSCKLLKKDDEMSQWLDRAAEVLELPVGSPGNRDAEVSQRWPYPVLQYLHGDITKDELTTAAGNDKDRLTEVNCYLALIDKAEGHNAESATLFHYVAEHGTPLFVEYQIAQEAVRKEQRQH